MRPKKTEYERMLEKALKPGRHFPVAHYGDIVEVVHQDGSRMRYENAMFGWLDKTWFAVWTEHNGVYVGHKGDIRTVSKVTTESLYVNAKD